jgi:hypothetical protein
VKPTRQPGGKTNIETGFEIKNKNACCMDVITKKIIYFIYQPLQKILSKV